MGARFSAHVHVCPGAHPASFTMGTGSFLTVKSGRGVTLTPTPSSAVVMKGWSYTSTLPMNLRACSEPQCLYKGALYLFTSTGSSVTVGLAVSVYWNPRASPPGQGGWISNIVCV